MNYLVDELPCAVTVKGVEIPVNYGFRAFLVIDEIMHSDELGDAEKVFASLEIFYDENIPGDIQAATDTMVWFQRCGDAVKSKKEKRRRAKSLARAVDYAIDSKYIYAAFLSQYNMDLNRMSNNDLHWWKFCALLECLGEEHRISKIMYWRTADTAGMSDKQKRFIKQMKELYALDDPVRTDTKIKLSERNRKMREYVQQRTGEVYGE